MRLKQTKTIFIFGCIFLGILLAIGHLITIFLDGELLAWQVVPPYQKIGLRLVMVA